MGKKLFIGCGVALLLGIIATVVGARFLMREQPKVERSESVTRGDVEIKVVETGTIEPQRKVEVKSKVGGRVSHLYVMDEGTIVKEGQLLASIDPKEINSQVAALQAQLSGARARLASVTKGSTYQQSQTVSGVAQAEQSVATARARLLQAQAEADVQPMLTKQSIASAQASLDSAKSALKAQEDNLRLMLESTHPQAIVTAQANYDQAKAQAENAQRNAVRQHQLLTRGFVSPQVAESADTDAQVAQSHLREVKERLDRIHQTNALEEANSRSQIASAQSQVRQQEAALEEATRSVLPQMKAHELLSAKAALAQAQAQLTAARSGKTQDAMRLDDATASKADVTQLQNQLEALQVQQTDTSILAPMSGVITKRYIEEGEIVTSAISSFSSGTAIFQISDLATMIIKINVNEVDIAKVKRTLLTEVTSDSVKESSGGALKAVKFLGKVSKVAPSAATDAAGGSSGSSSGGVIRFPVEIQIDKADTRLRPGMTARCTILVARHKDVLRLPINCVTEKNGKATVQVITSTTANGKTSDTTTERAVTLGLRGDDYIEIVSGIKEWEKVRPNDYSGPARKEIDLQMGPDNRKSD